MKDYHILENEVLSIFRLLNENEDNPEVSKLLSIFQKYWKTYQDNWPSRYWDTYQIVYDDNFKNSDLEGKKDTNESSKNNLKENVFKINNMEVESLIDIEEFKHGIEIQNQNEIFKENERKNKSPFFINNESILKNYYQEKKKRKNKNKIQEGKNTKDDCSSFMNLNSIDKELDALSSKSDQNKKSKNRSCVDDCLIF